MLRVTKSVTLEPQRKKYETVTTTRCGTMVIQQHQEIYDENSIFYMHGIMYLQTNVQFKVQLTNYVNLIYEILKKKQLRMYCLSLF